MLEVKHVAIPKAKTKSKVINLFISITFTAVSSLFVPSPSASPSIPRRQALLLVMV